MTAPNRPLPSPIPPAAVIEQSQPPTTGLRRVYAHIGDRLDSIRVALVDDDGAAWTFDLLDRTAEHRMAMIDVVVPHYSFAAFVDAAQFFKDMAVEGPNTFDQVRRILDRNGFVEVAAETWTEGQR